MYNCQGEAVKGCLPCEIQVHVYMVSVGMCVYLCTPKGDPVVTERCEYNKQKEREKPHNYVSGQPSAVCWCAGI